MTSGNDFIAMMGTMIAIAFHTMSFVTDRVIANPIYWPVLTMTHAVVIVTLGLGWFGPRFGLPLRYVFFAVTVLSVAAYSYVLRQCVASGIADDVTLASMGAMLIAVFCTLLNPLSIQIAGASALGFFAMVAWAYDGADGSARWLAIDGLALAGSFGFQCGRSMLANRQVDREFERLQTLSRRTREAHARSRQAETALRHEQERAEHAEKMASLAQMAGSIAHEINSPLSVIELRAAELSAMLVAAGADADLLQRAAKIQASVLRISKIMKGLRTIARKGDADPCESASLRAIMEDVRELIQFRIRGVVIELRFPDIRTDVHFECRATEIAQVLVNLLSNAIDAVKGVANPWIEVSFTQEGKWLEIAVSDSGPGLAKPARERLFQAFQSTKRRGEGMGLGLSISRSICEGHDGELFLDLDSPNTRFVARLPVRQDKGKMGRNAA